MQVVGLVCSLLSFDSQILIPGSILFASSLILFASLVFFSSLVVFLRTAEFHPCISFSFFTFLFCFQSLYSSHCLQSFLEDYEAHLKSVTRSYTYFVLFLFFFFFKSSLMLSRYWIVGRSFVFILLLFYHSPHCMLIPSVI